MANQPLPLLPLILDNVPPGLRQALAQEGIPVRQRRAGPPEGCFLLFDSRGGTYRPTAAGQVGVDVHPLRRISKEDPFEALVDERSGRFQWEIGGLTVTEEVARADKRAVRRQLLGKLRAAIEQAGGIWLRVAAFPFPYRSALNFRIDHDRYDPRDFQATLDALGGNERATSHFVNGAAYAPVPGALARLRGLDVGSHGYWHHTYRTATENLENVARGIEVLQEAGIEPSGFVAPHGRFNRGLLWALETLSLTHSSEFGLAYDELPFVIGSGSVLQIPVHPLSLGLFLEGAGAGKGDRQPLPEGTCGCSAQEAPGACQAAVDAAAEYFSRWARFRYRRGEPVFVYGHPTGRLGRHPQFLRRFFDTVSGFSAIWKTTLTEFAAWWRARAQVQLTVTWGSDQFVVGADRKASGFRVAVEYCRGGRVALLPLDGRWLRFSPHAVAYENRAARPSCEPVRSSSPQGWRGRILRMIDWERVTPTDEIRTGGWRNWAKRTLRRLRGA